MSYLTLVELSLISILDVALTLTIQRKISNVEKTYHLQNKTNKLMKELNEMLKQKDANKDAISAKQAELNKAISEQSMHQMRSTPILLVISALLYFFILPQIFPGSPTTLNLLVTSIHYTGFEDSTYFIVFTFIISIATNLVLQRMDRARLDAKYKGLEKLEERATEAVEKKGK